MLKILIGIIFHADSKNDGYKTQNCCKDAKNAIFLEKYHNTLSAFILMQNSYLTVIFESDRYFSVKMRKYNKYKYFNADFKSSSYIIIGSLFFS